MVKTISILEETHQLLREEYVKSGKSIKSIVKEAVKEYVDKRKEKKEPNEIKNTNMKE